MLESNTFLTLKLVCDEQRKAAGLPQETMQLEK
jgi:hypothetical protein